MLRTMTIVALGLAIAALGPMAMFSAPDMWSLIKNKVSSFTSKDSTDDNTDITELAASTLALEGTPTRNLDQVLRFNVSPGWVTRNWPRVSTGLAQLQLQGYRVPLVTGTAEDDLAGSLTYYFGPRQELQRIIFQGTTGNANKLVQFLATRYHFTRRLTNDAALFLYEVPGANGKVRSQLQIRSAGVVKSNEPLQRFDVSLVIERPEDMK